MSPTEEMYRSKTNSELKEMLEIFELSTPKAKNPFKPNKDEMVKALMQYKRHQDEINGYAPEEGDEPDEDEEEVQEELVPAPSRKKKDGSAEKAALLRADLMRMERVIVHDTQTSQTTANAITISWGNRVLGIHTDVLRFDKPWYIRRGALANIRDNEITEYVQDEEGVMRTETRHRYMITDVGGWTEKELAERVSDQNVRNSRAY